MSWFKKSKHHRVVGSRRFVQFEQLEDRRLLAADLVADIETAQSGSAPTEAIVVGDIVYFPYADNFGTELWRSDGTEVGTFRLTDINVGNASSFPSDFLTLGSGFVFDAVDENGQGLWYSDGTANGTVKLKDGRYFSSNQTKADVAGELFFARYDYYNRAYELWKSDGTGPGTVIVKGAMSGYSLAQFTAAGPRLFFTYSGGNGEGNELWTSDGTNSGTLLVKDITQNDYYGGYSSYPQDLIAVGNLLFFTADEDNRGDNAGGSGRELWVSDGTANGTFLLNDINPGFYYGYYSGNVANQTVSNGKLFFSASDGSSTELWVSNGTTSGTLKLTSTSASPSQLVDANGTLFFRGYDGYQQSLQKSDGSVPGTVIVSNGDADSLFADNSTLYFSRFSPGNGVELWKSDGNAGGTVQIADIVPGSSGSYPSNFVSAAGTLFFQAYQNGAYDLWKTDGSAAGTLLVEDFANLGASNYATLNATLSSSTHLFFTLSGSLSLFSSNGTPDSVESYDSETTFGSNPYDFTQVGDKVFFIADSDLWASDGTESGTIKVDNPNLFPYEVVDVSGTAFFSAWNSNAGRYQIWKSDGTQGGAQIVRNLPSSTFGLEQLTSSGGKLFFTGHISNDVELWVSDGTNAGTQRVKNINPSGYSYPMSLTDVDGTLYFSADNGSSGRELWKSDGTAAGTQLVANIGPGSQSIDPVHITGFEGSVIFSSDNNRQVWRVDPQGTPTLVEDFGSSFSEPQFYEEYEGDLYYVANLDEIWKVDGTTFGSSLVKDITPNAYYYSYPRYLTTAGGNLFFVADNDALNSSYDFELWKFDGLDATLVEDIKPGSESSNPVSLTEFQGKLVFFADDGIAGLEPWFSDGSVSGTQVASNIHAADPTGSVDGGLPPSLAIADDQLFFAANDGSFGLEPYRFTFPLASSNVSTISVDEGSVAIATGTHRFASTLSADSGVVVDNLDGTWTWTRLMLDGDSTQTVTITATDDEGLTETVSFDVVVSNVAPAIALSGAASAAEGSPYELTLGTISDPGTDTVVQWIVDWGDGTSAETFLSSGVVSHTYADGPLVANISVDLVDEDGTFLDAGFLSVNVENADPVPAINSISPLRQAGTEIVVSGSATDPAGGDDTLTFTYTASLNGVVVDSDVGINLLSFAFTPVQAGDYDISLTVADEDGGSDSVSQTITVDNRPDYVGMYRANRFLLDANGSGDWSGPNIDWNIFFGQPGDLPVTGDWDGDGFDNLGLRRGTRFLLDVNGNGSWDGPAIDANIAFGQVNDIPLIGDWNGDGVDDIGVRRNRNFILDANGNHQWDGPAVDINVSFGQTADIPISGDWDGDGSDNIGVKRSTRFILDINGDFDWDGPSVDANVKFGQPDDLPVIGDWDGDGSDNLGLRRDRRFVLDVNGNYSWDGPVVDANFAFGQASDMPLAGKWPENPGATTRQDVVPETYNELTLAYGNPLPQEPTEDSMHRRAATQSLLSFSTMASIKSDISNEGNLEIDSNQSLLVPAGFSRTGLGFVTVAGTESQRLSDSSDDNEQEHEVLEIHKWDFGAALFDR